MPVVTLLNSAINHFQSSMILRQNITSSFDKLGYALCSSHEKLKKKKMFYSNVVRRVKLPKESYLKGTFKDNPLKDPTSLCTRTYKFFFYHNV